MDNITRMIKIRVKHDRYDVLTRVKIGRALFVYASLPIFSFWAYAFAIPLMCPIRPTLWAKDKIRYFQEWRSLKC